MTLLALVFATAFASLDTLVEATQRVSCIAPRSATVSNPHPGAEQFYAGSFTIDEAGRVTGEERRYLYANSTWKSLGGNLHGEDCVDVWTLVGTRGPAHECKDCDFSITFRADLDPDATTCKRRLTPNGNHFKTTYNVTTDANKTTLSYPSGKVLGEGPVTEATHTWRSLQTCTWF